MIKNAKYLEQRNNIFYLKRDSTHLCTQAQRTKKKKKRKEKHQAGGVLIFLMFNVGLVL
jgi:hypothetical protein